MKKSVNKIPSQKVYLTGLQSQMNGNYICLYCSEAHISTTAVQCASNKFCCKLQLFKNPVIKT